MTRGVLDWLVVAQGVYVLAMAAVILWRYLRRSFADPVRSVHVVLMVLSYGLLTVLALAEVAGFYDEQWGLPVAFLGFGLGDVALLAFLYWLPPTRRPFRGPYGPP